MFVKDRLIEMFMDTTVDFEILPEKDVFQIRMFCNFEYFKNLYCLNFGDNSKIII